MNRIGALITLGAFMLLAGCSPGGIIFNGVAQVEQFPVRKTPIVHYNLPSEWYNPTTQKIEIDSALLPVNDLGFAELAAPGHDLWMMRYHDGCTDNPTCPTAPIPDWRWTHDIYKTPGPGWPSTGNIMIAGYCMSFQNQWFLRDLDGSAFTGTPPVEYENIEYSSMVISIHEWAQGVSPISQTFSFIPPYAAQQEPGLPSTFDANNVPRVQLPVNNILEWQYNGVGAPAGLLGSAWREAPAKNNHIESNIMALQQVPAPDYFGGGGPINAGGGVYMKRYSDAWQGTTTGVGSLIDPDDAVLYSYYLAAIGNHLIGYGVGLVDSSFALPGVADGQEDIMNISVIFDLSAFIAAGKQFQFVTEDCLRMQDVVSNDPVTNQPYGYANPGPNSTLPGTSMPGSPSPTR